MASSSTSLLALQQRISAIKANHTASNLTAEFTDYTSDKTWLAKISEDGNQPEHWLEYLTDLEKRGSNSASSLNAMYNKAIRDIPVYKHKKNDNYATILINSARLRASQDIDEARTLFKFARANIRFLARIHIAAAQLELDIGDKCKCRSVLCKGIEVGAMPVDLLKTALTRLDDGKQILNPQVNDCIVTDAAMIANHQQTYAVSTVGSSETSRSMSHDHSEDSTSTASYLQVDPSMTFKKRQRNPSDNRTEDTDTNLKRQMHLSQSVTKQTPSSQSLLTSTSHGTMHKMRKMGSSNTSLLALQQRITALKANNTADYTDNTEADNDKTVLSKIAEDGNQPDDWLVFLQDLGKRTNNNTSSLNAMYNKAIHDIPVYKHKKSDNYATILINSARLRATQDVDDARTLFKFARANIRLLARIHVAAAQMELDIGDRVKCKSILCKGIEVGATPANLLNTALTRLEAGEKVLNKQDTEFISDLSLATGHQKTSAVAQNNSTQMNSSSSRLDDTDTTVWLKRQQYLSQSATKQPCITPLSKLPLLSASTAGKPKMRALGAPMRVKREVLPSVDEDDHDDNKSFLHGIAPLNNRHSSRSDSSDNTDTSLHNTFPSLTFGILGRIEQGKNEHKKQTSSQLFSSPNESIVQNQRIPDNSFQHSKLKTNPPNPREPASNINPASNVITAASTSVSTTSTQSPLPVVPPSPIAPVISYLPVSATPSTAVPSNPSPAAISISHPPVNSSPPDVKQTPPINTASQVVAPAPVVSHPKHDGVISPPVSHPAPVISTLPQSASSFVPAPLIQNVLQPQEVRSQLQMQIDQNKNVIYVNNKQYTILKLVGKGGSSKVYQVYSADLKNVLAIKRVDLELADDLTKQGYINEITLLTQLQKKTEKIIKLYDFELTDSFIVMVMECGSIDLSTFLRRNKNISEDKIRFYWREMLETVNVIHQEGIVHSDLKPANFLFVEATLKLIDFGIANAIQVDQTSVLRDQQIGTLNYMSPEAIQDTSPPPQMDSTGRRKPRLKINCRSDVWSLGCILYYMVYGKTPFQHITNGLMKLQAIIDPNHEIQFPDINNKDLHDVLKKCLIRNPKQRPSIDTLLEHPFLLNKTQDDVTGSGDSGPCKLSAGQLEALISQLSTVRVHSPRTMSAISNAKALIEQLQKGTTTKSDQEVSGTPVVEMPRPISQPPPKQARMACRQPLQSVNVVDMQKVQGNMKPALSLHRHEIDDKENFGIRENIVNP